MPLRSDISIDVLRRRLVGLPALLGLQVVDVADGELRMSVAIEPRLLAPNGYLHAATVIGLADTACGFACIAHLPAGAENFTTIELKTNFLRSAQPGVAIDCEARLVHGGRTTQIWDATVTDADDRSMALFRCTQLLLRS
jgi:1,4-dihydroxy-2-naphthoyl-CoA hydrolase